MEERTVTWDALWDIPEHRALSHGPSYRHKMRRVWGLVRRHRLRGRALDVACGTGEFLACIAPVMDSVTGADFSVRALELARQVAPGARLLQLNIEISRLPETFDVVFCANALEEMERDEAALRNMAEMLAPNGALVLVVPHRKMYWTVKDELAGNKRRYEKEELVEKLMRAGLHVAEIQTWGWPLYRIWYRSMTSVNQTALWQQPTAGRLASWTAEIAYRLLFVDDLFTNRHAGSILFAVARKP